MTERVDVFRLPHKSFELPVMGTFEISGGKIRAWRDYFDTNQFCVPHGIVNRACSTRLPTFIVSRT
jgi:limonene-1,2-epoxide hydrolase